MPTLKDYFQSDLDSFFNDDEFAEEATINGQPMIVVMDSDLLKKQNLKVGEGLTKGELLFHVKKDNFQESLFVEKIMKFNQKVYRISDIQDSEGMYTITLVGQRS